MMKKSNISYTDREGMIATSFLIIYLLFSYVMVYWTKTISNQLLSRENMMINVLMYVIPCLVIVVMILYKESSLKTIGIGKDNSIWLLGLTILSLVFYTQNIGLKILLVVISEEIIFRGYAAERLKASYGRVGAILLAGVILGLVYSLIPLVNQAITVFELMSYIGLGMMTQLILQLIYQRFDNIILSIALHSSLLFFIL